MKAGALSGIRIAVTIVLGVFTAWQPNSLASLGGVVSGDLGGPIENAEVHIRSTIAGGPEWIATTDRRGMFVVGGLAPGTYSVAYRGTGFESRNAGPVRVFAGQLTTAAPAFLDPPAFREWIHEPLTVPRRDRRKTLRRRTIER